MFKKVLSILASSIISGILIAIGGIIFLSCESKYLGALFFAVGLFFICEGGFKLYTGAIGYALDNKLEDNLMLIVITIGNFIGTLLISLIIKLTRISNNILEKDLATVDTKLNDTWYSILVLAIMCGIMIYLGVNTFKKSTNYVSKVVAIFICVFVFIISGFEHCVANMFYISLANAWNIKSILYMLIMILGNSIGGLLIPLLSKLIEVKK